MTPYPYELEDLARETGVSPLVVLEEFLERAAIREYEGGMLRSAAEAAAYEDCVGHFAPSRPSLATLPRATSPQEAPDGQPVDPEGEGENARTGQTVNAWRAL